MPTIRKVFSTSHDSIAPMIAAILVLPYVCGYLVSRVMLGRHYDMFTLDH